MSDGTLAALERLLDEGGDVDDLLRRALELLVDEPGVGWASIRFVEDGALVPGPAHGVEDASRRVVTPIVYQGDRVGELVVDGAAEPGFLAGFADAISASVLLGWDTGGEPWEP